MKSLAEIFRNSDFNLILSNEIAPNYIISLLPVLHTIECKVTGNMRTITKCVVHDYLNGTVMDLNKNKIKKTNWKTRPIKESLMDTLTWIH